MTVGEKIQYYRKKTGLSQEELGQKIFVSRQTISLWEMDKTLPTVDNLIRLKEIFAVSIDDILSESEPTNVAAEATTDANEVYEFQYTKDNLRSLHKASIRPLKKRSILFAAVFAALFVFLITTHAPDALIGIFLGALIADCVIYIRLFVYYKKKWNDLEKSSLDSVCRYEVYDSYFLFNVVKGDEVTKTAKVYFEEIEKIDEIGAFLVVQHRGQAYIFDKTAFVVNSRLLDYCAKHPAKVKAKGTKEPIDIAATVLFALSIASLFLGGICVAIMSSVNFLVTDNMWVFFLFTPLTIASVILGVYLKQRGKKYKKNLIAGIVLSVILCLYGSFPFIFAGIYSHDEQPILRVEERMRIDIPEYKQITTMDWTKGTQTTSRGYIYYTSDVYFDESAVEAFEIYIRSDYRWIGVIPNELVGITSSFCDYPGYDYFSIYNLDTGVFNQLPSKSGRYQFINVLYNSKSNVMKIVEYEIAYIE